jgi:hypothetical protein
MVTTIPQYLANAEECERLAAGSKTEEERQQILQMAKTWRMLANQRRDWIRKTKGREPLA